MTKLRLGLGVLIVGICFMFTAASSVDSTTATIQATRMNGVITGGAIPYTDPVFVKMVADIQAGNYPQAASDAVNSRYFPYYLPRRMAKEMMNAQQSEGGIPDNDAVAFIVANFLGLAGTQPSIANIWSQNATYCVDTTKPNVQVGDKAAVNNGACGSNQVHMVYAGDPLQFDWTQVLVKVNKQTAKPYNSDLNVQQTITPIALAVKDVGGYMTLADVQDPNLPSSFGDFSFFALHDGTNLRAIEMLYEIAFGVTLASMENTAGVTADMTPRFIPRTNPNFLVGNNQPACISCHGGGASNRLHGYAAFADVFDYNADQTGVVYIPTPNYKYNPGDNSSTLGKSFGSNTDQIVRQGVAACTDPTVVCNPESPGVSQTQAWDLSYWQKVGLLSRWGWNGSITGTGLNQLGIAVGKATQVYQNMVQRVVNEICPTGSISQTQINSIASAAMVKESTAQSSAVHVSVDQGPFGYIVVQVASDPSCF